MGMERFALTTCARWGRFDAIDAMPLSDDAARDDSKHGRRRVRVMKQVVRLLHDRVLHVHLVAADVPVFLGDGVLPVRKSIGESRGVSLFLFLAMVCNSARVAASSDVAAVVLILAWPTRARA